jgi:pimeloyl-ACP methyl ester carboxylesterase
MGLPLKLPGEFDFEGQVVRYGHAGSGPPLVLVHGTPFSSFVWRRIAPLLFELRTVYWYDLLGYGQSEMRDGQDVSLGIQNKVLSALLRHWALDRPDVVAHDFGGATALRAHLHDGSEYHSLSLIDPVALAPWGSPFVQHVRRHEAACAGLPAYIHAAIVSAYIKGAAFSPLTEDTLAAYAKPWVGEVGQAAFYRQIAQMDQRYTDEIASHLGSVRCRTLIMWGEKDEWIPIERGKTLSGLIRGSIFRPIPGAGHLVQEDAPEAIIAGLMGFLDREV